MADIKTNLRDGAYVALGAAALGVQHFSRKRQSVMSRIEPVVKDVTPRIKEAGDIVVDRLTPLATKISPMAERVSTNLGPVAFSVVTQFRSKAEQAFTSTKKIADEAKKRVS